MAYTTVQNVKNSLTVNYWKTIKAKLTQDGWAFNEGTGVFTDESDFLQVFIDNAADFIESYVAGVVAGPFVQSGVLENINRWIATYDAEQYILAGTSDRVVSVTINEDKKRALQLLDRINEGKIQLYPADEDSATAILNGPGLIEPDCDGDPLAIDAIEDEVFFGNGEDIGTALDGDE